MQAAVNEHDGAELDSSAHRLRGSALNLGVPLVATICGDLEALGEVGRVDGAPELLRRLATELDRAGSALRMALAGGLH
jgi:HPt (histidine-containing phosphotransfer) domain-containing protein